MCSIEHCNRKVYAKGLCAAHWQRNRLRMDMAKPLKQHEVHGMKDHPLYGRWQGMIRRCESSYSPKYKYYGGRGITVCDRWHSFPLFLADMGEPPTAKHELERINNNGNYEPDNVRWATRSEQQLNKGLDSRNKSGVTGVCFDSRRNQWRANLKFGNKIFAKRFDTKEEAIKARELWHKNTIDNT